MEQTQKNGSSKKESDTLKKTKRSHLEHADEGSKRRILKSGGKPGELYPVSDFYGIDPEEYLTSYGISTVSTLDVEDKASPSTYSKRGFEYSKWHPGEAQPSTSANVSSQQEKVKETQDVLMTTVETGVAARERSQIQPESSKMLTQPTESTSSELRTEEELSEEDAIEAYCGICHDYVGDFNKLYPNLLQKQFSKCQSFTQRSYYLCMICNARKERKSDIDMHVADHIFKKEVTCQKCQIKYGKLKYDLEKSSNKETEIYDIELDPNRKATLTNFLVLCDHCENTLGQALDMLPRLSQMVKNVVKYESKLDVPSCKICDGTSKNYTVMKNHVLHHILNKQLVCKQCSKKGCEGLIKISAEANVGGFIPELRKSMQGEIGLLPKISCGKCGMYLGESYVLIGRSSRVDDSCATKTLQGGLIHICLVCSMKDSRTAIGNHISEHVNNIFCELCQHENNLDLSLIRVESHFKTFLTEPLLMEPVKCKGCNNLFSNSKFVISCLFDRYILKRKNAKNKYLNYCDNCATTFCDNIMHFKNHILKHISENEFLCPKCKIGYRSNK